MRFWNPIGNPSTNIRRRAIALLLAALMAFTALAGCVSDAPAPDDGEDDNQNNDPGQGDALPGEGKTLVIGQPYGWTGEQIRGYMIEKVLEDELGYTVETEDLDVAPIYAGMNSGDIDITAGAWLPAQQSHLDNNPNVEIIGENLPGDAVSYDLSVPKYVVDEYGIETIEDLAEHGDIFGNEITGIEPGAGMMMVLEERLEQGIYGLGDWSVVDSTTSAMLAAYDRAVQNRDPIVVTIWKPHYAYAKWTGDEQMVKLTESGEEIDGEMTYVYKDQTENAVVATLVNNQFEENHPEAAEFLKNFQVPGDDENQYYYEASQRMDNQESDVERKVAYEYIEANPELVQSWLS